MSLKGQGVRAIAPKVDLLRMGVGWKVEDLERPQTMVGNIFGDSHSDNAHLMGFVEEAVRGIYEYDGKGTGYFVTDTRNGMAQGHGGINYSLASRDTTANMIEIRVNATTLDAGVFATSCDKAVLVHLVAIGRLGIPSIVVIGGIMDAGPDLLTLERIGMYSAMCQWGEISEEKLTHYKRNAYPSCGVCSLMGAASTMQVMAEALGSMLPGSVLMSATRRDLKEVVYEAGVQAVELTKKGLKASDIATMKSFENAIMIHAAISGSSNSLLHIPVIAHEFGFKLDADVSDRMHRKTHYLPGIHLAGEWPAQYFYYVGSVPKIMEEVRSMSHLDVVTVTGKILSENLEELEHNGFYEKCDAYLEKVGRRRTDIIRIFGGPIGTDGATVTLKGNLAPEGAAVKHAVVPKEIHRAIPKTRPFDYEENAIEVVLTKKIKPGDVVFIHYEGPRGSGMPEVFYTIEAISSDKGLAKSVALITGDRFSGASKGPIIGHVSLEVAGGGPIMPVEGGDIIEIDIPEWILRITGVHGVEMTPEEVEKELEKCRQTQRSKPRRYISEVLKIFSEHTVLPMKGEYMEQAWGRETLNI